MNNEEAGHEMRHEYRLTAATTIGIVALCALLILGFIGFVLPG